MVTRHIHRVVVVDDEDALIGVLSALDLLRLIPGRRDGCRRLTDVAAPCRMH